MMTNETEGHTRLDYEALVAVDPTLPGRTQPRETSARCVECGATTWNQAGRCDAHWRTPAATTLPDRRLVARVLEAVAS